MTDERQADDAIHAIELAIMALRRDHLGHGRPGRRDRSSQEQTEAAGEHHHRHPHGFGDPPPWVRGGARGAQLGLAARFRMLDVLENAESTATTVSISELAELVGVDQPRASRLVAEATDAGLVRRAQDPADGRRSVVELTASGRTLLEFVRSRRRGGIADALADFSAEETATFAALLTRFVAAWNRTS